MDGFSQSPLNEKIEVLRSIMPEVFDDGKIDWEKLQLTLGRDIVPPNERYVLNWAGKSDAFRVMQQPSSATLVPCREESVDFDNTQNVFIEGENLEVLKVLQKSYFGKVKMIYIDPPYNTGDDRIYRDKYFEDKSEYLKRIGVKDEEGFITSEDALQKNSKENGQFHSNWLNMMMPRLFLAKNLLRDDGAIFISIDDNEMYNLRMLLNEIFGEENFVSCIAWRRTDNQPNIGVSARVKEYIICYAKFKERVSFGKIPLSEKAKKEYRYRDNKGVFRRAILLDKTRGSHLYPKTTKSGKILNGPWTITETEFETMEKSGEIYWTTGGDEQPYGKIYLEDSTGQIPNDFWGIEFGTNQRGSLELEALFDKRVFDFPKPVSLLYNIFSFGSSSGDIILDFFAGSGTTAHAVMVLNKEGGNRRYICVQLPELCKEDTKAYEAGYKTIAEITKERIRRAGSKIRKKVEEEQAEQARQLAFEEPIDMPDLGVKVFKLADSNFKQWRKIKGSNKEEWQQQLFEFKDPVAETATTEKLLYELILKSGKDLNSTIVKKDGYYAVNGNELILILEEVSQEIIDSVLSEHPAKVIALDRLFLDNDPLKTNTALQMRDANIDFKTI